MGIGAGGWGMERVEGGEAEGEGGEEGCWVGGCSRAGEMHEG